MAESTGEAKSRGVQYFVNEAYETTRIVLARTRRTEIATAENEPLDIENLMRRTSSTVAELLVKD